MKKPKKPKESPRKNGRPTLFNQELADRICLLVATSTMGLKRLCDSYSDLPNAETIRLWKRNNAQFFAQYARAKAEQADLLAEDILDIADSCGSNWGQARLQIDSRKWLASKLLPKIYGDKMALFQDKTMDDQTKKELMEVHETLTLEHKKDY